MRVSVGANACPVGSPQTRARSPNCSRSALDRGIRTRPTFTGVTAGPAGAHAGLPAPAKSREVGALQAGYQSASGGVFLLVEGPGPTSSSLAFPPMAMCVNQNTARRRGHPRGAPRSSSRLSATGPSMSLGTVHCASCRWLLARASSAWIIAGVGRNGADCQPSKRFRERRWKIDGKRVLEAINWIRYNILSSCRNSGPRCCSVSSY